MDTIRAFKEFLQKMIDSRLGPGKAFANADDIAKIAHVSKRNFINFKIRENQEPNRGVLSKMALALGFPEDYFSYAWDYFSGVESAHPDQQYPDYALADELTLLATDNEPFFIRLLLLVEQNPDFFHYDSGDLHIEKVVNKLEDLIAAEGQSYFL